MAVETVEVLALDALYNSAPTTWAVLTTATATLDMGEFRRARDSVKRAVVDEFGPEVARATFVEFQTGRGKHSGGLRRPHFNDFLKGVPADAVDSLREAVVPAWCSRVHADPDAQFVGAVTDADGLTKYLGFHFFKQEQAPPPGFRGHRFTVTKGYLSQPMPEARRQARDVLQLKRELWRAEQEGLEGAGALEAAELAALERRALNWTLVRLAEIPATYDDAGRPATWQTIECPVRS